MWLLCFLKNHSTPLWEVPRNSRYLFDQPDNYETLSGFCRSCSSWLVSLEIFPQQKSCWPCRQLLYLALFFYFSSFSMFIQYRILKSVVICSFCSFLCSFLLSILSILLFSTLLSIHCFVFSLSLFTLFSYLPYCFLFRSVILSFLFSYYSVLSASPLWSITIKSVLFLLVLILLDPST